MERVVGSGGVEIAVYDEGRKDGPALLLIHGFNQAALCWRRQRESELAKSYRLVSIDVRGHGASDKPLEPQAYNQSQPFADDITAVLDHLNIDRFVFVGWSMGGNWAADYVRHYGDERMRGVFLIGSPTQQGTEITSKMFGRGAGDNLGGMFAADPAENIAGTIGFLKACTASPLPAEDFDTMLAYNMMVPPDIRRWMLDRVSDNSDVIGRLSVPFMQVHGAQDQIVLPFAGEYTLSQITHENKKMVIYDSVGHCPFWEAAGRLNGDLDVFVKTLD